MKYSSTALIPDAVADLMKDPQTEGELLGEILKHQGQKQFVANVGKKKFTVSTVVPDFGSLRLDEILK